MSNIGINNMVHVSDMKFFTKILNTMVMINIAINFNNQSDANTEFEYQIPFACFDNLIFLSVFYRKQRKNAIVNPSEKSHILKFDDEVSCNNFSICLNKKNETTSFLVLANFHPNSNASIMIQYEIPLFEYSDYFIFSVPLIERFKNSLYPNYSIIIDILNRDDVNLKKIYFEYNRQNHTHEIKNPYKIVASKVSFESPLLIKIPKKKKSDMHINFLKNTTDILIFIDYDLFQNKTLTPLILDFIKNYGKDYKFNIILFGRHCSILFTKMMAKNEQSIKHAEEFFKNPNKTFVNQSFVSIFEEICGCTNIKSSNPCLIKNIKRTQIKEFNILNTVAICIGSIPSDEIIISKKVPTYIIDPIQKFDTYSFAINNNFVFIGPITHDKNGLRVAFETALQLITIGKENYFEMLSIENQDNQEFYTKIDEFDKNKSFSELQEFIVSNNLDKKMNIIKIHYLIENIIINMIDIEEYLKKNDLYDLINDLHYNKQLVKLLTVQMIIETFGNNQILKYYENQICQLKEKTKMIEFFKSIEKEQFIVFNDDEDETTFIKNDYLSLHRPMIVEKENDQNTKDFLFEEKIEHKKVKSPMIFYELFTPSETKLVKKKKNKKKDSSINVIKLISITESRDDSIEIIDEIIDIKEIFSDSEFLPQIDFSPAGSNFSKMYS